MAWFFLSFKEFTRGWGRPKDDKNVYWWEAVEIWQKVRCLKVLISDLGDFLPYQQTSIIQKQNLRLGFMKQNLIWIQIPKKQELKLVNVKSKVEQLTFGLRFLDLGNVFFSQPKHHDQIFSPRYLLIEMIQQKKNTCGWIESRQESIADIESEVEEFALVPAHPVHSIV